MTALQSGLPVDKLSGKSALYQDVRMTGDDVDEFADSVNKEFGSNVGCWPWERFTDLSEPSLLSLPRLIWQLLTWRSRGTFHQLDRYERLTLEHIAAVIDRGEWFEP